MHDKYYIPILYRNNCPFPMYIVYDALPIIMRMNCNFQCKENGEVWFSRWGSA